MDHPGKDSARHDSQDRLVVELHHLGFQPLARVGGKALNLGKIAAAGLPVPAGFCLTTSAYRSAVPAEVGVLAARLESLDPGDAEQLSRLALEARDLVNAAPMPPEVDAAVRTAYAAMGTAGREQGKGGEPAVAVRSSATAEDLPFASFAGQQDSVHGYRRSRRRRRGRPALLGLPLDGPGGGLPHGERDQPPRGGSRRRRSTDGRRRHGRRAVHRQPGDGDAHGRLSLMPARDRAGRGLRRGESRPLCGGHGHGQDPAAAATASRRRRAGLAGRAAAPRTGITRRRPPRACLAHPRTWSG